MTATDDSVHPDQDFQRFLAQGRFMIQRSRSSGRFNFPPRVAAPGSGTADLEWTEASGDGTLYAFTVISQKPPSPGYSVCLVDLAEGPRVLARLVGVPPRLASVGAPVRARIATGGQAPLLEFELADAAATATGATP
jgi:uncharacterized OB-fold protein